MNFMTDGTSIGMREAPNILEEHLRACLQDQYDIAVETLEFLPRGLDFKAGVYRVMSKPGTPYLLKVTSRPLYKPGYIVPRYLRDQGIASVVAPVFTKMNGLWTKLMDWTVIVYPFIDGDTSWTGMTNEQWKEVGSIFQRIHSQIQPEGFSLLRKETFDPTEYIQWIRVFETQHLHTHQSENEYAQAVRTTWVEHQSTIHTAVNFLEKLAGTLKSHTFQYVICHADLHPANLIRDDAGHVFVIDWDEVMLAPKERDFIFVREPHAEAFWEGYEKREVDRVILAYFLWERVIQDVIVNAEDVCFRDNLGEETRAEIAQLFQDYMKDGENEVAAAYEASTDLDI